MNPTAEVLANILQRLARLEAQAGRSSAPETLVPNSYSVDAAGNVNSTGINLPAGTGATPPNQDRIRWLRSDGVMVADIFGFYQGGGSGGQILIEGVATTSAESSAAVVQAKDDQGTAEAFLAAQQAARGTTASVIAGVAGVVGNRILLDQATRSDWVFSNNKATTATAGAQALPANPAGFVVTKDTAGNTLKIPYYNP